MFFGSQSDAIDRQIATSEFRILIQMYHMPAKSIPRDSTSVYVTKVRAVIKDVGSSAAQITLGPKSGELRDYLYQPQSGKTNRIVRVSADDSITMVAETFNQRIFQPFLSGLSLCDRMWCDVTNLGEGVGEVWNETTFSRMLFCIGSLEIWMPSFKAGFSTMSAVVLQPMMLGPIVLTRKNRKRY